jgi:WD40 repeat protein
MWWLKTLSFAPDGKTLAVGRMQTESGNATLCDVRIWALETRQLQNTFSDGRKDRSTMAFSPDGHTLALGGAQHSIILWRLTAKP